ncbi:TPA: hypothetical protein ACW7MN_003683 [Citrobacter freundii]
MKEICTSQYKDISGGFADVCGRGDRSTDCGGSRNSNGGNDRITRIVDSKGRPGSGIMASSFFDKGSNISGSQGGCTGGSRGRELGGRNH